MFVTGLQFLPVTNQEGPPISSDSEAAVLSISVDNKICIHSLQQRRKYFRRKSLENALQYLASFFNFRCNACLVSHYPYNYGDLRLIYSLLLFGIINHNVVEWLKSNLIGRARLRIAFNFYGTLLEVVNLHFLELYSSTNCIQISC